VHICTLHFDFSPIESNNNQLKMYLPDQNTMEKGGGKIMPKKSSEFNARPYKQPSTNEIQPLRPGIDGTKVK
jgi:hypothetical protein